MERNRSRNLDKAPPRIEGTNMIDEMQKVGLNTRNTQDSKIWTQAEESKGQIETNTLLENYQQEKQNRIALQEKQHQTIASYNQKVSELEEAIQKQKIVNMDANKQALAKINNQQEELKSLQMLYNNACHEKERLFQKTQALIKSQEKLEQGLQNKEMEMENHILHNEISTQEIKNLKRQVKDLSEMEIEYITNQEEFRKEIADLESSLGSQQHNN